MLTLNILSKLYLKLINLLVPKDISIRINVYLCEFDITTCVCIYSFAFKI